MEKRKEAMLTDYMDGFKQKEINYNDYEVSFRRWLVSQIDAEKMNFQEARDRFKLNPGDYHKILKRWQEKYSDELHLSLESMSSKERADNKKKNDYSGLIELTDILNNTPADELACKLESRFNVEDYLKIMAVDIAVANWDDYIFAANNYYLYDNPKTGKFEFIPYDFDNTFGTDWIDIDWGKRNIYNWSARDHFILNPDSLTGLSDEERIWLQEFHNQIVYDTLRPLYYRLLEVEVYRNQFNAHLKNIIDNYLGTDKPICRIVLLFLFFTRA